MTKNLDLIILLDDNDATNYIHKRYIKESERTKNCIAFQNGSTLLDYFNSEQAIIPDLLFVDINMPEMDVWEFLNEFEKIKNKRLSDIIIILLSTVLSPADEELAKNSSLISAIHIKPLSVEVINNIISSYFSISA